MTTASASPRVVVGVDGSAESVAALAWAKRYATATGATITAVLAWHYPPAGLAPAARPQPITEDVRADMQAVLDKTVADVFNGTGAGRVQTRIAYGHPAQVLTSESADADLLVVGNRGHGAFTGMTVGSVSMHCVSNSHCPVVVVRGDA
jgi:nucleotide-binding universal stress UspA family protein